MGTGIGPGSGLHAPVSQTGLGVGLGSGPDGQLPVIKLRGLPFSCDEQDVKLFLVRDCLKGNHDERTCSCLFPETLCTALDSNPLSFFSKLLPSTGLSRPEQE